LLKKRRSKWVYFSFIASCNITPFAIVCEKSLIIYLSCAKNIQDRLRTSENIYCTTLSDIGHTQYASKKCIDEYPFGFNGQEKVNEVAGIGNWNTALYWEYNTRTGIRGNLDPKPNPSVSPYATFGLNPIQFADPLGDSIFVNNRGYILRNDHTDKMVFINWNNKPVKLGEIGKVINAEFIFKNLMESNIKTAKGIINPFTFKGLVRNRGEWDYKSNMKTIYGLANHTKGVNTKFKFGEDLLDAPDLGNIHFGAVGKAYGLFSEKYMLQKAGEAQMAAGTSKSEWQKYKTNLVPAGIHSDKLKVTTLWR
jgi:hypothetical protein